MLVLSRKKDQKVVLPGLNVTIQVIRCSETSVKLGFDAPPEVRILRHELGFEKEVPLENSTLNESLGKGLEKLPPAARHDMRNKLNILSLALHTLKDEIAAGELKEAEETFERLVGVLDSSTASGEVTQATTAERPTVLLVEDQENEREMLANVLRMSGYQVMTAKDGVEALDFLDSNEAPNFVLVDMQMPRCDGPTFVHTIRESKKHADLRVYVVSGTPEDECDLDRESVDSWHMKPVDPRMLIDSMIVDSPTAASA